MIPGFRAHSVNLALMPHPFPILSPPVPLPFCTCRKYVANPPQDNSGTTKKVFQEYFFCAVSVPHMPQLFQEAYDCFFAICGMPAPSERCLSALVPHTFESHIFTSFHIFSHILCTSELCPLIPHPFPICSPSMSHTCHIMPHRYRNGSYSIDAERMGK